MKHALTPETFAEAVGNGPLIALDPGTKTIGVAVSDDARTLASPLETIRRSKLREDIARLLSHVEQRMIKGIVIGMPLNMDGSVGRRAQSVRAFGRSIEEGLGLPVLYWDERLSTFAAGEAMKAAGVPHRKHAEKIDAMAAAEILQGALDRLATAAPDA